MSIQTHRRTILSLLMIALTLQTIPMALASTPKIIDISTGDITNYILKEDGMVWA